MSKALLIANGSGEVAQAIGFAKYLREKKHDVLMAIPRQESMAYLATPSGETPYPTRMVSSPEAVHQLIEKEAPEHLFIFNSKLFYQNEAFINNPPAHKPKTYCLDANWLYGDSSSSKVPCIAWADRYLCLMPQEIFEANLKENGGHYEVSKAMRDRIEFVGLMPDYLPASDAQRREIRGALGLKKATKMIFIYFGSGVSSRIQFLKENIQQITKRLNEESVDACLVLAGTSSEAQRQGNMISLPPLDTSSFYEFLSCSDLVLQHEGFNTLAQCVSAQVPVICNTPNQRKTDTEHDRSWELEPFAKAGACEVFEYKDFMKFTLDSLTDFFEFETKVSEMKEAQSQLKANSSEKIYKLSFS